MAFYELFILQNWFHVKSELQKNPEISTLCEYYFWFEKGHWPKPFTIIWIQCVVCHNLFVCHLFCGMSPLQMAALKKGCISLKYLLWVFPTFTFFAFCYCKNCTFFQISITKAQCVNFRIFCIIQILREIDFGKSRCSKPAIFSIVGGSEFW